MVLQDTRILELKNLHCRDCLRTLHPFVHVPSMALSMTPYILQILGEAQARGLDITASCYPYTAFGTGIGSAVFDEGWQARCGIDYSDLQWAATGEVLSIDPLTRHRPPILKACGMCL